MGPIGSGKTSVSSLWVWNVYQITFILTINGQFINVTTGNKSANDNLHPATDLEIMKFQCIERCYLDILFIDTPGFDDARMTHMRVIKMIINWLKKK